MKRLLFTLLIISLLVLAGCGEKKEFSFGVPNDNVSKDSGNDNEAGSWGTSDESDLGDDSGDVKQQIMKKEFVVKARQFEFEPSTIEVNKGDTVRIILISEDVAHGLGIKEFDFNIKAEGGENVSGEFVADKQGTFTFYCSVFCGSDHKKMTGELIVR